MDKISICKDFKYECNKCFCVLTYQKQPHNCLEGEEDEGFECDLRLFKTDFAIIETTMDDGFFDTV